jgi:hypothetical protein
VLEQHRNRGLSQLKPAEYVLSPMARKALIAHIQESCWFVPTRVVNRDLKRGKPPRFRDKAPGVLSARSVADNKGYAGTGCFELVSGRFELYGVAASDRDRMAASRKTSSYGCAEAARCADTDD